MSSPPKHVCPNHPPGVVVAATEVFGARKYCEPCTLSMRAFLASQQLADELLEHARAALRVTR
jgi:hypothetical protein